LRGWSGLDEAAGDQLLAGRLGPDCDRACSIAAGGAGLTATSQCDAGRYYYKCSRKTLEQFILLVRSRSLPAGTTLAEKHSVADQFSSIWKKFVHLMVIKRPF
jgi:hypothetical protein